MSTFYTCVPKIMIIRCILPEVWSTTDTFFCHFGPFFAPFTPLKTLKTKIWKNIKNPWRYYPFTHMHHTWRWYDVWFLRYRAWQKEFFVILGYFSTSDIPNNLKNQNFEKMKKNSGYIIILNMCTINENHMINGSWDMEHNRHTFLSFWPFWVNLGHFCPFTHKQPKKSRLKKRKKILKISFYTWVPKTMIICYTVHEIWHVMDVICIFHFVFFLWCMLPEIWSATDTFFCHFGPFFALLPH